MKKTRIVLCWTGATGLIYGVRAAELLRAKTDLTIVCSSGGLELVKQEWPLDLSFADWSKDYDIQTDLGGQTSSGSSSIDCYLVLPCSVSMLTKIALGLSDDVVSRAVTVALKEKRSTVIVVREMPLSEIHLQHLVKLQKLPFVHCFVASPTFYHHPVSIDDLVLTVVSRAIQLLKIPEFEQPISRPWNPNAY